MAALLAAAGYLAAVWLSDPLLTVRTALRPADVIVVLGGDGPTRAMKAAGLYRRGLAPRVLVTGDGDCTYIAGDMVREGVRPDAITLECRSGTTEENAAFSRPLVERMRAASGIIVTSWFHSRRAVATFEAAMPEVRWLSAPTEPGDPLPEVAGSYQGVQVAKEYPKAVVYALRRLAGALGLRALPEAPAPNGAAG